MERHILSIFFLTTGANISMIPLRKSQMPKDYLRVNSCTEKKVCNIDVSVIIVNWNSGEYLRKTINSLYTNTRDINFELIVLDNNSNKKDESYKFLMQDIEGCSNAKVIVNKTNLGFAKANNIGIDSSSGKHILLLNPDAELKSNTAKILSEYLDKNPTTGIVGPKVLNSNGTFQNSCMRGEPYSLDVFYTIAGISKIYSNNTELNKFGLYNKDTTKIHHISGLSGCCMMIRKELFNTIEKLDERFFLYFEETDLCWRAKNSNWDVVYNPNAVIVHEKGVSTGKKFLITNYHFISSMIKFASKHHFKRYNLLQQALLIFFVFMNLPVRNSRSLLNIITKKYEKIAVFN